MLSTVRPAGGRAADGSCGRSWDGSRESFDDFGGWKGFVIGEWAILSGSGLELGMTGADLNVWSIAKKYFSSLHLYFLLF